MPSTPMDPIEQLRQAADRAVRGLQYRVSVSPHALRRLLDEHEEMRVALERKKEAQAGEGIEHTHRNYGDGKPDDVMAHAHTRGDVPHGHHGWRYDNRPAVKL